MGKVRCMEKVRYHDFELSGDCVLCWVQISTSLRAQYELATYVCT